MSIKRKQYQYKPTIKSEAGSPSATVSEISNYLFESVVSTYPERNINFAFVEVTSQHNEIILGLQMHTI